MKTIISIQDFYARLESLDWRRSSSGRGSESMEKLELTASQNAEFMQLLSDFRAYAYSGDGRQTPKIEKPMKPKTNAVVEMMVPVTSQAGAYLMQEGSKTSKEIWDKTTKSDGHFILREVSGRERLLGVFFYYEDVNRAACIAADSASAGCGDVLIENIRIFSSIDDYMLNQNIGE